MGLKKSQKLALTGKAVFSNNLIEKCRHWFSAGKLGFKRETS